MSKMMNGLTMAFQGHRDLTFTFRQLFKEKSELELALDFITFCRRKTNIKKYLLIFKYAFTAVCFKFLCIDGTVFSRQKDGR